MNKRSRETLDVYYKEAESWAGDRQHELAKSRKMAWRVAAGACAIALLEGFALVLLMPLKTERTVTLLVDRNTGFVQAVRPQDEQRIAADTALTQSMLVQYVTQREGFDHDSVQSYYRHVTLWSAENARADYMGAMQASNPQSPLARYPRGTVVEVRVKSVSPVARNVAMVRYDTILRTSNGQVTPQGSWVSVIRYRFTGEPMRQEDRFANPLGFQVVRYRKDQEALPSPEQVGPQQPGAAGPQQSGAPQQPGVVVVPTIQRPQAVTPPPQQQRPQQPPAPEVEL